MGDIPAKRSGKSQILKEIETNHFPMNSSRSNSKSSCFSSDGGKMRTDMTKEADDVTEPRSAMGWVWVSNLNFPFNSLLALLLFSFAQPRAKTHVRPPNRCLPQSASRGNFSGANLAGMAALIRPNLEASPSTSRRAPLRRNLFNR